MAFIKKFVKPFAVSASKDIMRDTIMDDAVAGGLISCAYPLDDDGTLAASFGVTVHIPGSGSGLRTAAYTYTDTVAGAGPFAGYAAAMPSVPLMFGPVFGSGIAVEVLFNAIPAAHQDAGLLFFLMRSGSLVSKGFVVHKNTEGVGTGTITRGLYGEVDSTASGFPGSPVGGTLGVYITDGILMVYRRPAPGAEAVFVGAKGMGAYQNGDEIFFALGFRDNGFITMAGGNASLTILTDAGSLAPAAALGLVDRCGNVI